VNTAIPTIRTARFPAVIANQIHLAVYLLHQALAAVQAVRVVHAQAVTIDHEYEKRVS